jgi:hypothetical protein
MRAMGTEEPFRRCFRQGTRKTIWQICVLTTKNTSRLSKIHKKHSERVSGPKKDEIRGACKYFRDADFSQQKIHIFLTLIRDSSATI